MIGLNGSQKAFAALATALMSAVMALPLDQGVFGRLRRDAGEAWERYVRHPFVLALGCAGARIDHVLAVFNALLRHPGRACVILGPQDAVFLCPPQITLRMRVGDRLSLFPMGPVTGEGTGLRWPIAGLPFAPDGQIGTSNEVSAPEVRLRFDAARMLVIVPRLRLDAVLTALVPGWRPPPARGGPAPVPGR